MPLVAREDECGQSSGESVASTLALARSFVPVSRRPGDDTASAGALNRSSNWRRDGTGPNLEIDLEEALEAPGLQIARSGEQLLAVADERLRVQHLRVLENADACVQERSMVEVLSARAGPVVRVRGDEEADANAATGSVFDAPDHPAVGDVRVDDVQRLGCALEQSRDRVGDRPVLAWSVVEDDRRHGVRAILERGEEGRDLGDGNAAAEPAKAGEKHELELRDDGTGDANEQVVEATVLEVVLDSGAADPADPAVDDDDLAMVDVPERAEVPAHGPASPQRPGGRA